MTDNHETALNALRARIDSIDSALMALLDERIGVIHEVAALKRQHTPAECHIRPGREGAMHRRVTARFATSDFPATTALMVWRQIIGASTHLESPITLALAGGDARLAWHAREYFGRTVTCMAAHSIAEACDAVRAKRATIALLPAPSDAAFAEWEALLATPALRVFASLPVVLAPGEAPAAYAVAAVACEESGNDVTLRFVASNAIPEGAVVLARSGARALISASGFTPGEASLGSLPAPIIDPSLTPWYIA